MARPLRIQFPGALYHLTSRGNARASIFFEDGDRALFLALLADVVGLFRWSCHAYCLMPNHYHLLVETPEPNLSRGMQALNGRYTQRLNHRHGRVGHVFQGRFSGILVQRESHLAELARYVVLNPVRAGLIDAAEEYPWSSLRATLGLERRPEWLDFAPLLARFGTRDRYLAFVREGRGARPPWGQLRGSVLGSEAFARSLGAAPDEPEVPRRERLAVREGLDELFTKEVLADRYLRDERIVTARCGLGYSLAEIARHLGLHDSTISKVVAEQGRGRRQKDLRFTA